MKPRKAPLKTGTSFTQVEVLCAEIAAGVIQITLNGRQQVVAKFRQILCIKRHPLKLICQYPVGGSPTPYHLEGKASHQFLDSVMAKDDSGIPWYSWIILVLHLGWSVTIILMTKGNVYELEPRWIVTGIFIAGALGLGLYDFIINKTTEGRDTIPFDLWTIIHTLAGIVFGLWYVPLIWVLVTVFWWEFFEFSVKGFGEKEAIINRAVDVGVAVVGWLVVVIVGMIIKGSAFPLANPVTI